MHNIQQISFGDLYATPSKNGLMAPARLRGTGVPLINMREIFSFSRINTQEMELAPLPIKDSESWLVETGDLLFARQSLVASGAGKCVLVQEANFPRTFESHIIRVRLRRDLCNPTFFFYYFNSVSGRSSMASIVEQVAAAGIRASDLSRLQVPVPPLALQNLIAETLGALDDKIESNRRIQNLIEDLVRAKVSRALESSEGVIGCLSDYCSLIKQPVRIDELRAHEKYISFEHMPKGSITLDKWGMQTGLASQKSSFRAGDILFGKLRPYFKKVGIAPVDGVCSSDILVLRPRSPQDTALVAIVASSDSLVDSVSAAATGTRMPRASWRDISSWPVPQLLPGELQSLSNQVSPLIERLISLTHEQQKLIVLRDTLVPAMLKGEFAIEAIRNG